MTDPAARTRLFAKALGPFLLLFAVMIFARYETLSLLLPAFRQDGALTLVVGAFVTLAGCFMLAGHNHFTSPAAIAITVLAALFIVRGVVLMLVPEIVFGMAMHVTQVPLILLAVTLVAGAIGAWLSFVGWFAKSAP